MRPAPSFFGISPDLPRPFGGAVALGARPTYTFAPFFSCPWRAPGGARCTAHPRRSRRSRVAVRKKSRNKKDEGTHGVLGDTLRLEGEKQLLKQYYAGHRMESPNGGYLMLLGIRPVEGGSAVGIFECSASSLRYEMPIPKATRAERKKVREVIDRGEDPDCPRHGVGARLVRAGRDLVCQSCGVAYARA